jgi:hypothetical protein
MVWHNIVIFISWAVIFLIICVIEFILLILLCIEWEPIFVLIYGNFLIASISTCVKLVFHYIFVKCVLYSIYALYFDFILSNVTKMNATISFVISSMSFYTSQKMMSARNEPRSCIS